ncbi:MAG: Formate hydrogenlyase transcriptional activator [Syntrophorhabdus sp. PtaU1.Bin153]|nr:MAG: Formate hydrogenlyase transcriptional activator [Syntrophorhabdus sp. PtaU1.Bin153]
MLHDLTSMQHSKPDIPQEIQARWQRIVELLAKAVNVPAALIWKLDTPQIEVLASSEKAGNPFVKGDRKNLDATPYCAAVIQRRAPLLIPDARKDPEWENNPVVSTGMTYYLGYPLAWPDDEIFGTICVLDRKENPRATELSEFMVEFQHAVEMDLRLIMEAREREELMAELEHHRDLLQSMLGEQAGELKECSAALEERFRFEELVADLSSRFVNIRPDDLDDEIAGSLRLICGFFKTSFCCLMEVLVDSRQIRVVREVCESKPDQGGFAIGRLASSPEIYNRIVDQGEPMALSRDVAMTPGLEAVRDILEEMRVSYGLLIPVSIAGRVTHVIVLLGNERFDLWPQAYVHHVRLLGEIFSKALISRIERDALAKSETNYRELVQNANSVIIRWQRDGTISFVNEYGQTFFGYSAEELIGKNISIIVPQQESAGTDLTSLIQDVVDNPERYKNNINENICKDGRRVWMTWTNRPLFDEHGRVAEVLTIGSDVTKQKHAEEALRKSEMRLVEAQRVGQVGSWEWDIIEDIHHWSEGFYRVFGLPLEETPSYERFLTSIHPDDREAVHQANTSSISDPEKPYSIEYRVVQPDGAERIVHARAEIFFDQNRKPIRMVGTVHDMTDRKHAEQALEKAFVEIKALKDQLEAENIYLRDEMELKEGSGDIIGKSNPIQYVLYQARQAARTKTTVLLTGETGTGKGLFARFLHQESDRRDKQFVHVNCAGLPANLIESELFGREKGAFTGSTARQIGRFELANNGTIFLDEIGELSLELQAKLLRVIEDGEFERLGSPHSIKVNVRIIASTNRNLEEEIKRGRFREDLFFRLNVFPITIPPLRQRKGDIPLLVKSLIQKFNKTYGKDIKRIPTRNMESLEQYPWPGNIRELINVIERAVIVSDGPDLRLAEKIIVSPAGSAQEIVQRIPRETRALAQAEREHILEALHKTGWRVEGPKGAAQLLEVHPNTLRARMKKLGIRRPRPE